MKAIAVDRDLRAELFQKLRGGTRIERRASVVIRRGDQRSKAIRFGIHHQHVRDHQPWQIVHAPIVRDRALEQAPFGRHGRGAATVVEGVAKHTKRQDREQAQAQSKECAFFGGISYEKFFDGQNIGVRW